MNGRKKQKHGKARAERSRSSGTMKSTSDSAKGKAKKGDRPRRSGWSEWGTSLLMAFGLFLVVRVFLIQTFVITSGSMEGTLLVGDFLVVNRAAIGSKIPFTDIRIPGYSEPRQGDILVFDPHHEENMTVVKRLIGTPGDTLEMRDKVLYRNGKALVEPYVVHSGEPDGSDIGMMWQQDYLVGGARGDYRPSRDNWGPIALPEDRYFMMGDNRDMSYDSRNWGLLEGWRFQGRAVGIYFSYNKGSYRPFPWIKEIRGSRIGQRVQ